MLRLKNTIHLNCINTDPHNYYMQLHINSGNNSLTYYTFYNIPNLGF